MIRVSRLNEQEFVLNAEQIKFIEQTPDTVITLISGERLVVIEDVEEVVERVLEYKRSTRMFPG